MVSMDRSTKSHPTWNNCGMIGFLPCLQLREHLFKVGIRVLPETNPSQRLNTCQRLRSEEKGKHIDLSAALSKLVFRLVSQVFTDQSGQST